MQENTPDYFLSKEGVKLKSVNSQFTFKTTHGGNTKPGPVYLRH